MFPEAALLAWSGCALVWWIVSVWLVPTREAALSGENHDREEGRPSRSLTIFKPLPPLSEASFDLRGVESFIAQLDDRSEMLLGVHERDLGKFEPWLAAIRNDFPAAKLRVVWRKDPGGAGNPKVAWLKILAPHATGEFWLWSDADIAVPSGFLDSARAEYAAAGARLLTWSYIVGRIESAPALLDALYVNVEFFPGVLLLRRLGPVDFGLGAALLFSRADFEAQVDWSELGAALADDFVLGQKLKPVRIGRDVLTTSVEAATWRGAILHYLRWSKTVRWSRPGGTAARLVTLPMLGWLAYVMMRPASPFGWAGLVLLMQADVAAAALICRRTGCRLRARDLPAMELWSIGRALAWLACWLPWPVIWRGQVWRGPFDKS